MIAPTLTLQAGSVAFGTMVVNNTILASTGLVRLDGPTRFNGQGGIVTTPQVALFVARDLLGDTRNPAAFNPRGQTVFRSNGGLLKLEVMSQDRGATPAG